MCGVKRNHLNISRFAEHAATHNYSFDMGSNDFWPTPDKLLGDFNWTWVRLEE
jgi:hypothetical protein